MMRRTPIIPDLDTIPARYHPLMRDAEVYDSSCSPEAKVYFIDRDGGCYLKTAGKGTLAAEARMDDYFHTLGLGPEMLDYQSLDRDWLLTRAVPGEDCTHKMYLEDPKRLSELLSQILRHLHSQEPAAFLPNRLESYLTETRRNYREGKFDASLFPDNWGYASAEEAWRMVETNSGLLKADTLIHGDYCLPNVMLHNWKFSGFIDLGRAGLGDKHMDIFWGAWTLRFNLKTDAYCSRFLDAYGRENFDRELLRVVAALEVFL